MKTELIENLRGMTLFRDFTNAEVEALLDLTEPITFGPNSCVVRQDDHGDAMYVLVTGKARVVHRKGGRRFELAQVGPGDFFGEIALVDEGPRSADVETLDEETTLLRIHQSVIRALAGVYPNAAFKFLIAVGRVMVSRMRSSNRQYIDSLLLASRGKD